MPFESEAQRRAMYAAASGHSTLGIPESAAKKFISHSHKDGSSVMAWDEPTTRKVMDSVERLDAAISSLSSRCDAYAARRDASKKDEDDEEGPEDEEGKVFERGAGIAKEMFNARMASERTMTGRQAAAKDYVDELGKIKESHASDKTPEEAVAEKEKEAAKAEKDKKKK